jgi:hypothetical protein
MDKIRKPSNSELTSSLLMHDACSTFLALLCNLNNCYVLWILITLLTKAHNRNLSSVFNPVNITTPNSSKVHFGIRPYTPIYS